MRYGWVLALLTACAHERPELNKSQVRAGIRADSYALGCREAALRGEGIRMPTEFDIGAMICRRDKSELQLVVLRDPQAYYQPKDQYGESAYYCPKERVWYYRYTSPDGKLDTFLGPYLLRREAYPESDVERDVPR